MVLLIISNDVTNLVQMIINFFFIKFFLNFWNEVLCLLEHQKEYMGYFESKKYYISRYKKFERLKCTRKTSGKYIVLKGKRRGK